MRRRTQHISEYFPPARLYIDDIVRIHRILQIDYEDPVNITSGAYEFDEPSQLREMGESVRDLGMTCRKPGYVSVGLSKGKLRVWASEDTGDVLQKVRDIKEVIDGRRRPLMGIFSERLLLVAAAGIGLGLGVAGIGAAADDPSEPVAFAGIAIAFLCFAVSALSQIGVIGSVVYTVSPHERPGWWKRNRDAVVVSLIIAVVSFVLGYYTRG